jgi:hypothetical protein
MYHNPALLTESLEALNIKKSGTYVDVTFGGGGHSKDILNRLGKDGMLVAFDRDEDAQANIPKKDDRFLLIPHNYAFIKHYLQYLNKPCRRRLLSRVSSPRCWNCRPTVHIILRRCAVPAHVFWPTCLQDCPLA